MQIKCSQVKLFAISAFKSLGYFLFSITLLHTLAHCSWSNQLIFAKCMHLHSYFTDFDTFKSKNQKKCAFLIKKHFYKIGYFYFKSSFSFGLESLSIYLLLQGDLKEVTIVIFFWRIEKCLLKKNYFSYSRVHIGRFDYLPFFYFGPESLAL